MRAALALALLGVALTACGHTTIVTNDKAARIYANGEYLGRGEASYGARTGFPGSMQITVKTAGAKVAREVKREFTLTTFFLGAITYMTGWIWGWQYPENVIVLLPAQTQGGWDEAPSAWDLPPSD